MNEGQILYRVDEAARMLSISRSEAYSLVYKGVLPHIRIRSMIRIPAKGLREWIEAQQRAAEGRRKGETNEAA